jgi:hypothetical protein
MHGWTSPRLNVRFEFIQGDLSLYGPDGKKFATYVELAEQRDHENRRAEHERQRAEQECQRAEHERQRADRLAAQLKAMGIDPGA